MAKDVTLEEVTAGADSAARPRESAMLVLQRGAERFCRHDAQIDLQSIAQSDRHLGVATADDRFDARVLGEA